MFAFIKILFIVSIPLTALAPALACAQLERMLILMEKLQQDVEAVSMPPQQVYGICIMVVLIIISLWNSQAGCQF